MFKKYNFKMISYKTINSYDTDDDEVFLREKSCIEIWFSKTYYNFNSCKECMFSKGKCDLLNCTRGTAPDNSFFSSICIPFAFVTDIGCLPCTCISVYCCN